MGTVKDFFCDLFGIETKEEKEEKLKKQVEAEGEYATMPSEKPASEQEKEEKEEKWADVDEKRKFVCQGGKVSCQFHSGEGTLMPTSTEVMLQDKPYVTNADKDGKVNFLFTGICKHPSHGSNKPPCMAVISLGEWKNCSTTHVDNYNPILVESTIPCMISGQDLKVTFSGQKTNLSEVEEILTGPDQIVQSIEILKGDVAEAGTVIQYVNINRDAKYVDGTDITHIDRLGQKLRFKVKFDKPGISKFKIKLIPESTNVTYTANERSRNPNFKYSDEEVEFRTDVNGEKIIYSDKVSVSPAGGDIFTISVKDMLGTEIMTAGKVKTQRMMYYVEAKMTGLTSVPSNLSVFTNEYDKHNIAFKGLPSINITHMPNIGNDADSNTFKSRIQAAYNATSGTTSGPSKSPYCVIIGYTDHLAVKTENQEIPFFNVIGGSITPIIISIADPTTRETYALWKDIIPSEDWFVECYFIKNGGTDADKVTIEKTKCTPIQNTLYATGYCDSVSVDISSLPADTGTITLKINWVNRMRGGVSFGGTNIVAICTKAWWQTKSEAAQCQVIIHEIGHQLGMVTNGSGKLPAKTSYFYDNSKGHVGPHCHYDIAAGQARYDSPTDGTSSKCVMYGATNGRSAFCVECAKALKKVDLVAGV